MIFGCVRLGAVKELANGSRVAGLTFTEGRGWFNHVQI